jgi:hypothetical protein
MMTVLALWFVATACHAVVDGQALSIVSNGESRFTIYHAPDAVASVKLAAEELQEYITKSTGVELPIVADEEVPSGSVISLGVNAASNEAGVDMDQVPVEGFRIATSGDDLYILGPDTAEGEQTLNGGVSTGTLNGVYVFLEDELGIRWVLPGEMGESVPQHDNLIIEAMDRIEGPRFAGRRMPTIQTGHPLVAEWMRRNRVGSSLLLAHYHNWRATVPPRLFDEHPEWFAMHKGKRVPPGGEYMLETTNPELVRYFADRAIEELKNNPDQHCFSLSPSDSTRWSDSPESNALMEKDPYGKQSSTPMILKFYNDVAKLIYEAMPERIVAGYIYADYLFPPQKGIPELAPNLYLVVAPISQSYGYRLYQDWAVDQWINIVPVWGKGVEHLGYYDLPNKLIQNIGGINDPALDILDMMFPLLDEGGYQYLYIYGITSWSHGGLTNYLLAKLMWDPKADVRQLAAEFYQHAYGPEAGPIIQSIYEDVATALKAYHQGDGHYSAKWVLNDDMLEDVYASQYESFEQRYLQALEAADDPAHRDRVAYFGHAMVMLRWNLEHKDMIEVDPDSPLHRTDEQIDALINQPNMWLALAPNPDRDSPPLAEITDVKITQVDPLDNRPHMEAQAWRVRGQNSFLLYPQEDSKPQLVCPYLDNNGEAPRFILRDADGEMVTCGVLREGREVDLDLTAGQVYYLDTTSERARYEVAVRGCPSAVNGRHAHLLPVQAGCMMYFHVASDSPPASVTISSRNATEQVFDFISPSGEVVATLARSGENPAIRFVADPAKDEGGFWGVIGRKVDYDSKIKIELSGGSTPWVVLDPTTPLLVQPQD